VVSDRFSAYNHLPTQQRQLCWAHLIRDLTAIAERPGASAEFGAELLGLQQQLFAHWHHYKQGTIDWPALQQGCRPIRQIFEARLQRVVELGAGEILLTSMDGDGTQAGYELELTRAVADAVEVPVIASGGAGCIDHIAQALDAGPNGGHASAALLASLLHDGVLTMEQIKTDLLERGLMIRPLERPAAAIG